MDTLHIPHIESPADADNIINTLEEKGVRRTIDSLNWHDYPYHPLTTVSMGHSDTRIYIDFFVRCNYLRAINYEPNTPVHEDSCVSVYLQPQPGCDRYFALDFNCIGTVAAAICTPQGCTALTDSDIARINVTASCGKRPFRELEGLFAWNVLVDLPLDLLGIDNPRFPLAMRGNFYKCASGTSQPHFLSWAPVPTPKPDFHRPEYFGDIMLD